MSPQLLLEYYCSNIPSLQLDKKLDTVRDSLDYLGKDSPDLLFPDIELNDGLSWNILDNSSPKTKVIVTTRNPEYVALAKSKYGISQALLKPIALSEFLKVINEVVSN